MVRKSSLRERKKTQQRERIADVAARLFAEYGYDAVSVADVARGADVSDQTVYNYFPAKKDLVLDRADEFRELYANAVRERPRELSPARSLVPLVADDIARYRGEDWALARGEFPAQCLASGLLRRFALELREQQADAVALGIREVEPRVPVIVARAHAAALISVVQQITDQFGTHVLNETPRADAVEEMTLAARQGLDELDRTFQLTTIAAAE